MKADNDRCTICEVLRCVNDMHQGRTAHDMAVCRLLAVAEQMAKKMSHKLLEYNEQWDADFYKANPNFGKHVRAKLGKRYIGYRLTEADRKEFGL